MEAWLTDEGMLLESAMVNEGLPMVEEGMVDR